MASNPSDGNGARSQKWSVATAASIVFTLIAVVGMGSFVFIVTHHPVLSTDEYKTALWFTIQSVCGYGILSYLYTTVYRNKDAKFLWRFVGFPTKGSLRRSFKVGGAIGFMWATNYVCIFVAGSFIPIAIQVILAQLQLLVTYVVNFFLFQNDLSSLQHLVVGTVVGIQLGAGAFINGVGLFSIEGLSSGWTVVWCIVYAVNVIAAGISNNCVEALLEAARVPAPTPVTPTGESDCLLTKLPTEPQMMGDYNHMDYILAINLSATVWAAAFCIVPYFLLAVLAYREEVFVQVFAEWTAFGSTSGQLFLVAMSCSSVAFGAASCYMLSQLDALIVAVVVAVSNIVQISIFNDPTLPVPYYSPVSTAQWEVNVTVAILSVIYCLPQWKNSGAMPEVLEKYCGTPKIEDKYKRVTENFLGRFYINCLRDGYEG